ncbi:MAG: tetratricopeptide repeat protein [Promethearchaeota archaeon]
MPKDYKENFEKGKQLFKRGKYEAAIKNFNSAIEKNPQFELAWRLKAKALYYLENYEEANICIDKALELNSSSADAWLTKMYLLLQFNKYEEALNCCNEALKIHPNKYWLQIAYVHEQFKHFKEALECVDKALAYNPKNTKAQRVKSALLNGINYGKNYYIPIARSPLLNIIPPDDEIIYSTELNMDWAVKFTPQKGIPREVLPFMGPIEAVGAGIGVGIAHIRGIDRDKGSLITDALMTSKGLGLFIPKIKRQDLMGLQYLPWNKVVFTSKGEIIINNAIFCKLHREPLYESLEVFKQRYNTFHKEIRNLRHQYTKVCLEKAKSYAQLNQDEKALQWVKEGYKSNVFLREYNLSDDLMLIEKSILDKQRIEAQQIIKGLEDLLINYFVMNKGKSFTTKAILYNLRTYVENPNALEYLKKNIKGLLNKLIFHKERILQSEQKDGVTYYSLLRTPTEKHIELENFQDYKIDEALLKKEAIRKEEILDKEVTEEMQPISSIPEKKEEKPVKNCPHCGQELSLEAKFCVQCGEKLEELKPIPSIIDEKKKKPAIVVPQIKTEEIKPKLFISDKKKEKPKEISYICKFCGYKLNKKFILCPQCGTKIKKI